MNLQGRLEHRYLPVEVNRFPKGEKQSKTISVSSASSCAISENHKYENENQNRTLSLQRCRWARHSRYRQACKKDVAPTKLGVNDQQQIDKANKAAALAAE
jgi:hypothetical protein